MTTKKKVSLAICTLESKVTPLCHDDKIAQCEGGGGRAELIGDNKAVCVGGTQDGRVFTLGQLAAVADY